MDFGQVIRVPLLGPVKKVFCPPTILESSSQVRKFPKAELHTSSVQRKNEVTTFTPAGANLFTLFGSKSIFPLDDPSTRNYAARRTPLDEFGFGYILREYGRRFLTFRLDALHLAVFQL